MNYVFLSEESAAFFQVYGPPPEEWYSSFDPSLISLPSCRAGADVMIYAPTEFARLPDTRFTALVIQNGRFLPGIRESKTPEAFNRVLRLIQSCVDQSISIPLLWKPFNADSLIAIQASPRATGERARLLFDRNTDTHLLGVCHGVIADGIDLAKSVPSRLNRAAITAQLDRIRKVAQDENASRAGQRDDAFDLEATNQTLGLGDSLQTWYESKLTNSQRNFADFALTKSVRVRGPAGSGKTIAMVVKLLRQLEGDRKAQKRNRYAFLTHSEATVDLVRSMIRTMITESEFSALTENGTLLYLGTLYSLAFEMLGTELRGVQPLSLDGRQGREMQREMLDSVFVSYLRTDWVGRKGGCTEPFVRRFDTALTDDAHRSALELEILNEFACVLEPDRVATNAQRRNDYVNKTTRETWRMSLATPEERLVLLDLYTRFRAEMKGMEAISVDQLIVDFDRFLQFNAWELTRETSGFNAIFVDELHLLNRLERMLITSLQREVDSKPVVVMAEDVKQDIRRVGSGMRNWQGQFESLKEFDLNEVFRYTPQINDFLRCIDEFAPTLNLQEDWPNYQQQSNLAAGPLPDVTTFRTLRDQYDGVFPRASEAAKRRKNGRFVAVLTCDYDNFKNYLRAGQHRDLFIPVESREDITSIPSRGTRFVMSMPEFVAGLQFEEVFLIDVSETVLFGGDAVGVSDKRRGLATVYLGSSRAMKVLHIGALAEAGGLPAFVQHAVDGKICKPN